VISPDPSPSLFGVEQRYRLLASNASAVLAGRLMAIGAGVVLSTILFRELGPRRYGAWSLLMLVAGYSTLMDFGLAAAIERRVAGLWARGARDAVIGTIQSVVFLLLATSVVAQGIAIVAIPMLPLASLDSDFRRGLMILPTCTGVTLGSLAVGAVLAGQQRMATLHAWRTAGILIGTATTIACVWAGAARLDVLVLSYTGGSAVTLAAIWLVLRRTVPELRLRMRWDAESVLDLVRFGGVVQVATMVPPLAEYGFRLIIGARFGLAYAGVYDLAARAAVVPRSIAGALFSAMVPFAVQTDHLEGRAGLAALTTVTGRFVAMFILPTTALLLAVAQPLIVLWLQDAPLSSQVARCFRVLLIAHAIGALTVPAAMVGRAVGRPAAEATATVVSFAAAVAVATVAPSLPVAAGVLWGFPALGGFVVWVWLARQLVLENAPARGTDSHRS
jgi:O-antigen/teichoic acid export membrane protein